MAALPSQKPAAAAPAPASKPVAAATRPSVGQQGKSGLVVLEPGQDLFKENDPADSLFIIQKGQIRLYKPKGKGFIELAILRSGEVLGEMAYFGDGADSRRSCSASAITRTEIIAISFVAFGKAIENLNPWFKTIITTLADRLRKTNARVKELESNSVSGSGGSASVYEFLKDAEISKILSMLYLTAKALGEKSGDKGAITLSKKLFKFYASDVFALSEAKYEEFFHFLQENKTIEIANDKDNLPNILIIPQIEKIKSIFSYINTQRGMKDEEKFSIGPKCEQFMDQIVKIINEQGMKGPKCSLQLNPILENFKERNIPVGLNDLEDARKGKFLGDFVVGEGKVLTTEVNKELLDSTYANIKFQNALKKWNERKSKN